MSTLSSSKDIGDSVESVVINREPGLEPVGDAVATWYDARTVECLDPSSRRPFLGIPLVESGTEVEIKGACVTRSNGTRECPGHWYIKREAHEELLEAGGVYILVVYAPFPDTPVLASAVVPASILDEHLRGSWYEVSADRSESEVVQLSWSRLIDRERVSREGGVDS